jgi:hypothetical protein
MYWVYSDWGLGAKGFQPNLGFLLERKFPIDVEFFPIDVNLSNQPWCLNWCLSGALHPLCAR